MSQPTVEFPIELHLFSPTQSHQHIELLTTIAHYHRTGHPLNLHHTVNFGRPWLPGSLCDHGLISLPYLDGPRLELLQLSDSKHPIRCLWLLPITQSERDFKVELGTEALEQKFQSANFNYADPHRPSVV